VEKTAINGKRRARKLALQALYQWAMSHSDLHEIEAQFRVMNNMEKVDTDYFCHLLHGIPKHLNEIENLLKPLIDRAIDELNPIELTTLRIGTFELVYRLEIPYKVVLDEAVSLTKAFGSQDGFRYVNGVLNNLARQVRSTEISCDDE
jgi:N utilization substance protein B